MVLTLNVKVSEFPKIVHLCQNFLNPIRVLYVIKKEIEYEKISFINVCLYDEFGVCFL